MNKSEEERGETDTAVSLCKKCGGWVTLQVNDPDMPENKQSMARFYLRVQTVKVKDIWARKFEMCECSTKSTPVDSQKMELIPG